MIVFSANCSPRPDAPFVPIFLSSARNDSIFYSSKTDLVQLIKCAGFFKSIEYTTIKKHVRLHTAGTRYIQPDTYVVRVQIYSHHSCTISKLDQRCRSYLSRSSIFHVWLDLLYSSTNYTFEHTMMYVSCVHVHAPRSVNPN